MKKQNVYVPFFFYVYIFSILLLSETCCTRSCMPRVLQQFIIKLFPFQTRSHCLVQTAAWSKQKPQDIVLQWCGILPSHVAILKISDSLSLMILNFGMRTSCSRSSVHLVSKCCYVPVLFPWVCVRTFMLKCFLFLLFLCLVLICFVPCLFPWLQVTFICPKPLVILCINTPVFLMFPCLVLSF